MKTFIIRTLIVFGFIYVMLASIIILIIHLYQSDFSDKVALEYGYKEHDITYQLLTENLFQNYEEFTRYIDNHSDINTINDDLDRLNKHNLSYQKVIMMAEDGLTIDGVFYPYKNSVLFNQSYRLPYSFFKLSEIIEYYDDNFYGAFLYSNFIGLYDAKTYLDTYQNMDNLIIMHKNGFILSSKEVIHTNLLNQYLDGNTTYLFNDFFSQNKSDKVYTSINGSTYIMAFTPIDELNLYVVNLYLKDKVLINFSNLSILTTTSVISMAVLFLISNLAIFYLTFIAFNDIEDSKISIYYHHRPIIKVNKNGKIIYKNKMFKAMIDESEKYQHIKDLKVTDMTDDVVLSKINKLESFGAYFKTKTKETQYINFIPLRLGFSHTLIGDDVTTDQEMFRTYEHLALLNTITQLPNMNALKATLNDIIETNKLSQNQYTLVAINIIDFRSINKLIGETLANDILIGFVKMLDEKLTKFKYKLFNTYVDNFVILFRDSTKEEIIEFVESFTEYVENYGSITKQFTYLDIRSAIYQPEFIMGETITSDQMIERLMYALKHANSSQIKYAVYDVALRELVINRMRLEENLIEAVKNREFVLYLQPQYHMDLKQIISFEALIRWHNPKYNHVSPQEFIRIAEENNLIIHIGELVIEETLKIAKVLEPYNIGVSMNVSPVQMLQNGFVDFIANLLEKYKITPGTVAIEITETFMVSSFQTVAEKLKKLQKLGIAIHLDDFGMGYSSLLYLKDLPIDLIKIDKQFVDYIVNDKYSKAIINMIVSLAKSLDVPIIAEGVETEQQAKLLQKFGVKVIQGYLISKAVPLDEALKLIGKYTK